MKGLSWWCCEEATKLGSLCMYLLELAIVLLRGSGQHNVAAAAC